MPGLYLEGPALNSSLEIWTVYDRPSDFPDEFVARKFQGDQPTSEFVRGATLAEVRKQIPRGFARLDRMPLDDPKIVEVWL